MTIRLSVAIQHHPSRADLLPPLLEALNGLDVDVVTDPDPTGRPSPWRCYQKALELAPAWATHRLIVQDDVVPCAGFAEAAVAALEACGSRPVAFWVGGAPADRCAALRRAQAAGCRWLEFSPWQWFPCVASAWPADDARRLVAWAEATPHRLTPADDAVVARFLQTERIWPRATIPSLVEHPDVVASVIGRKAWAGRDKGRVACVPGGDADVSQIGWVT